MNKLNKEEVELQVNLDIAKTAHKIADELYQEALNLGYIKSECIRLFLAREDAYFRFIDCMGKCEERAKEIKLEMTKGK